MTKLEKMVADALAQKENERKDATKVEGFDWRTWLEERYAKERPLEPGILVGLTFKVPSLCTICQKPAMDLSYVAGEDRPIPRCSEHPIHDDLVEMRTGIPDYIVGRPVMVDKILDKIVACTDSNGHVYNISKNRLHPVKDHSFVTWKADGYQTLQY